MTVAAGRRFTRHQHCPACGDTVDDVEYAVRWPWPGSCSCMRPKPLTPAPISYTGCECHERADESWFRDHLQGQQKERRA